jgi:hypothetical protein
MSSWRGWLLAAFSAALAIAAFALPPLPQPLSYHAFADCRTIWSIPNFFNVFSNLPYLVAGMLGLSNVFSQDYPDFPTRRPWLLLMVS